MMGDRILPGEGEQIRALFDRIAPVYDQLNDWLSLGQHRIWKQMAVKWSNPQPGDTGLDLCCGSGDLALLLAREIGATGRVVGVDFAPAQLAVASQRAAVSFQPLAPLTWMEADVLNLPFENNQFDCATMGYGLRNVVDIPRCLQELHRVLKPGGKAAILDLHRPDNLQMRQFQQWYLDNIVVPVAARFGLKEEYAYLTPSLEQFPTGREQVNLAQQAGFAEATHYPLSGGLIGVLAIAKN